MERILIVDDDKGSREVTSYTVRKLGYEVVEAENGNCGLEVFCENGPFYVVVTDYEMPEGNGDWLAEEILKKNTNQRIIVMSSSQSHLHEITDSRIRTLHKGDLFEKLPGLLSEVAQT